jgi:diguanylate cyclase (GGDEF)-like protein
VSRHDLKAIAVPGAILLLAGLIALLASHASVEFFTGATVIGPFAVLFIATLISIWFNRGRACIASASLGVASAGYSFALEFGATEFPAQATLTALSVFVPANILIALALPERGITYFRNYRWLMGATIQIVLTAWVAGAGRNDLSGTVWVTALDHWLLRTGPLPLLAGVLTLAAFGMAAYRAWTQRAPVEIGMLGVLIAFSVACLWPTSPVVFGMFMFSAGTILLLAVLQESHRMAFQDELTGLPGRRALEERLVALGPVYTMGMVDVDNFKKFNDTHGHDVGDHVLRMVGARLSEVGGGGRAFRYGGEEFCVLFDGQSLSEAMQHLEAIRQNIEQYRIAVRSEQRRKNAREENDRRFPPKKKPPNGNSSTMRSNRGEKLSVTVSIGVAERSEILDSPKIVIRAADRALYRAKEGGRNRVST